MPSGDFSAVLDWVASRVTNTTPRPANRQADEGYSSEVCWLLSYLADQMLDSHKARQGLENRVDIFAYVDRDQPFVRIEQAFVLDESQRLEQAMDLEAVRHDVDDRRMVADRHGARALELQVKFRDPDQGWMD